MHITKRLFLLFLVLAIVAVPLFSCNTENNKNESTQASYTIEIDVSDQITLKKGKNLQLHLKSPEQIEGTVTWSASNICATVDQTGRVYANYVGVVTITASCGGLQDSVTITIVNPEVTTPSDSPLIPPSDDPSNGENYAQKYINMTKEEFYADYTPAENATDAYYRSLRGFMSGSLTVPDQAPVVAQNRPMQDGKYIRNSVAFFASTDTYVVVDSDGDIVMEIYRGGAYITLEEVAAYVYAFGDVPANYTYKKNADPTDSIWGEYLRLNNSYFSGDVEDFPYEPVLPNIDGCGGELAYYEIDIGTTGTDCDPRYDSVIYNDGYDITRGAARIVYARYDINGDHITDPNERYLFYTYNHYNDFQEYLNYYGGWGEMFGNITGGGSISSKYDYNPTSYVEVVLAPFVTVAAAQEEAPSTEVIYFFCPIIDTKLRAA